MNWSHMNLRRLKCVSEFSYPLNILMQFSNQIYKNTFCMCILTGSVCIRNSSCRFFLICRLMWKSKGMNLGVNTHQNEIDQNPSYAMCILNSFSTVLASKREPQGRRRFFWLKKNKNNDTDVWPPLNHYFTEFAVTCPTLMHVFEREIRELYIILKDVKRAYKAYGMNIMHKVCLENVRR